MPRYDFSTNANACGPCPAALQAVQTADARHYPDPAYTALRAALAAWHGVAPQRVLLAASASEFIQRITACVAASGFQTVLLPAHGYGEYERAATAWGLTVRRWGGASPAPAPLTLHWACEPSSPLGQPDALLDALRDAPSHDTPQPIAQKSSVTAPASGPPTQSAPMRGALLAAPSHDAPPAITQDRAVTVIDCAYAPLRLDGAARPLPPGAWQLWSPNKALGLTGVRAAYAIAPPDAGDLCATLALAAPSWPVGAHGVALLHAWTQPDVQAWLAATHATLRQWKARQINALQARGWQVQPSVTHFFTARPALPGAALAPWLAALRTHGIKLRDGTSFGLPGWLRLAALPPAAQDALSAALDTLGPPR